MTKELKPCDGTWQDYARHRRRKEEACAASKREWRLHVKELRAAARKRGKNL